MKMTGKKICLVSLLTVFAISASLAAIVAVVYWRGVKANLPVQAMSGVTLTPPGDCRLGGTVTASVLLKLPWHRRPLEATAEPGKGAVILSAPTMTRQHWRLGHAIWKIAVEMKPYRTGLVAPGKLEVRFNRHNEKNIDLAMDFRIPEFKALPLANARSGELLVAGGLPEPGAARQKMLWTVGAVILALLIVALLYSIFRKRSAGTLALSPWDSALLELAELRVGFRQGRIELEICFVKLTDVVRAYLEKRFRINAPQQTTYEFLNELNKPGGALPESQRPFLREFMTAADLVKFARLPPDEHTLSVALDKAEALVTETRPVAAVRQGGDQ